MKCLHLLKGARAGNQAELNLAKLKIKALDSLISLRTISENKITRHLKHQDRDSRLLSSQACQKPGLRKMKVIKIISAPSQ